MSVSVTFARSLSCVDRERSQLEEANVALLDRALVEDLRGMRMKRMSMPAFARVLACNLVDLESEVPTEDVELRLSGPRRPTVFLNSIAMLRRRST